MDPSRNPTRSEPNRPAGYPQSTHQRLGDITRCPATGCDARQNMRRPAETPPASTDFRSARFDLDQTGPKSHESQSLLTRLLYTRCLPYSSPENGVGFPVAVRGTRKSRDWRVIGLEPWCEVAMQALNWKNAITVASLQVSLGLDVAISYRRWRRTMCASLRLRTFGIPTKTIYGILPSPQSGRDPPRRKRSSSDAVVPTACKCVLMESRLAVGFNK